ncbi:MAG: hypothetical protein EBX53_01115 [Betaproteobacteria bacterium]|nr:hypothetical protein [Betaproteobacteria bacterium]
MRWPADGLGEIQAAAARERAAHPAAARERAAHPAAARERAAHPAAGLAAGPAAGRVGRLAALLGGFRFQSFGRAAGQTSLDNVTSIPWENDRHEQSD